MSSSQNYLFPLILDILSNKPLLTETQNNLLKDLSQKFKDEGIKLPNLKKELQMTVDLGKGLGILTVQNEEVRMPFLLKDTKAVGYMRPLSDSPERPDTSKSKTDPESTQREKPVVPDWSTEPQKNTHKAKTSKSRGRSRKRSRSRSRSSRRRRKSTRSKRRRR